MTRQQKWILLVLGIVNLGVLVGVGGIVLHDLYTPLSIIAPLTGEASVCEQQVLAVFSPALRPTVAWTSRQLTLQLQVAASPQPDSAQYLWLALDTLAPILRDACAPPETVILAVSVGTEGAAHRHLAQFSGEDLAAWGGGSLSEADLTARARYRHIPPPP